MSHFVQIWALAHITCLFRYCSHNRFTLILADSRFFFIFTCSFMIREPFVRSYQISMRASNLRQRERERYTQIDFHCVHYPTHTRIEYTTNSVAKLSNKCSFRYVHVCFDSYDFVRQLWIICKIVWVIKRVSECVYVRDECDSSSYLRKKMSPRHYSQGSKYTTSLKQMSCCCWRKRHYPKIRPVFCFFFFFCYLIDTASFVLTFNFVSRIVHCLNSFLKHTIRCCRDRLSQFVHKHWTSRNNCIFYCRCHCLHILL